MKYYAKVILMSRSTVLNFQPTIARDVLITQMRRRNINLKIKLFNIIFHFVINYIKKN